MGRGKIEIKRIENKINRQVTFSKRRQGLLKKAHELSVLCDSQIALLIFSETHKLYTFPNSSYSKLIGVDQIIQRYLDNKGIIQLPRHTNNNNLEEMYKQTEAVKEEIRVSEQNMRHYLAQDLPPLPLDDLHRLELQLDSSLNAIRARKNQLMDQQLQNLQTKEQMLQVDNGSMNHWLMGAGQDQLEVPFFGEEHQQLSNSTVLQLATSSSSPQFHPYLRGYE
ncbi:hypothetical protein RND81_12G100900 [Saponaria officinalis]|uniref:Uncharacterized protein n=1 Tax=Saponaria officinalis TaxID=3572 RepID=A0AAW1H8S2_SAPOF